ncbi:MAG: phosphodiester glycosidase family protein [Butyrivibrio sp.]|nr:phosphodiester glycosidase family protein [Butyrivibrio sp.]
MSDSATGTEDAGTEDESTEKNSDTEGNSDKGESSKGGKHSKHSKHNSTAAEKDSNDTKESETTDTSETDTESTSTSATIAEDGVIGTYNSDDAQITITQYTYEGTTVYVADVTLSSAEYIKTAFAQGTYGKNVTETTSSMAEDNNAILAINGDNYGSQESGYVIRNGIVYRDEAGDSDVLCIYADGSMEIIDSEEYTAQELVDNGVWQAFSFGPALIEDGTVSVDEDDEVGKAKASNPRTAIGIIDDLNYIFVVSDGRTDESEGLSLYQLAEFMESLGADTAYNLDGGGSSTMVFNGEVINNPTTTGNTIKEREVNDIVYIG